MPSASDVRPTSHDRHDPLLVAALAAGDLAANDLRHATSLIETCADCARLHDDLRAIARATAIAPPPFAMPPRDFRLTREQAARLRPAGWRRVVAAFAAPRLAFTRPLGIGLTTLGLAGLLLGNVQLGFPGAGSAAAPANPASGPAAGGNGTASEIQPGRSGRDLESPDVGVAGPVASGRYLDALGSPVPAPAAASGAPAATAPTDQVLGGVGTQSAGSSPKAGAYGAGQPSAERGDASDDLPETGPTRSSQNVIFATAVLSGLALLVLRRVGRSLTPR